MNNLLQVSVMTPKETLFKGQALAVSSKNAQGKFDILAEHANFITIIENQPIEIITEQRKRLSFKFSQAIICNTKNFVSVFAEPKVDILIQ